MRPPEGLEVEEALGRLTVRFPATHSWTSRPLTGLERALSNTLAAIPYVGITLAFLFLGVSDAVGISGMLIGAVLSFSLAHILPDSRRVLDRHPAASAVLTPHHLTITKGRSEQVFSLEGIEKVTVDAAGARLRHDGKNHYLLPERPEAERAWLADAIVQATQRRQASSEEAEVDRRRLAELLKQRQ